MSLTTDPNDPRLCKGPDNEEREQCEVYLVLSDEERAKGFVRPVRTTYVHVGNKIERNENGGILGKLIHSTDPEYDDSNGYFTRDKGYSGYIKYPESMHPTHGRYITTEEYEAIIARKSHYGGCGVATTMGTALAETYARDPKFYGSTYCVGCKKHLPVEEFQWDDGTIVGS